MRSKAKQMIHWFPRILAIFGILFLSIFALHVFEEYETLGEIAVALTMDLVPAFVLIFATIIAWRWQITGGVIFIMLGLFSIMFFNTYQDAVTFLLITVPPLVVGLLFLWEGFMAWAYLEVENEIARNL